jgi:glutamine cyclotransferase
VYRYFEGKMLGFIAAWREAFYLISAISHSKHLYENGRASAVDITVVPAQKTPSVNETSEARFYSYDVVNSYPHDKTSFTQGLAFYNGTLYESVGQHGRSKLRQIELETGSVVQQIKLPSRYFAEGIAILDDRIYQVTWQEQICFVYDLKTFTLLEEMSYDGEGWGLATDGECLIKSDGSNRIYFVDPKSFNTVRAIEVFNNGDPLLHLNDLEYIRGEIYANVWHSDYVVRIHPESGEILGWIDLSGLLPKKQRRHPQAVLNGIAYDQSRDRLLVAGKLWPKLFEIRLKIR